MKQLLKLKIAVLIVAAFASLSSQAVTILTWSDTKFVGQVAPGVSDTIQGNAAFINSLVDRSHYITPSPFDVAGQTYLLFNSQGGKLRYADANAPTATGGIGSNHLVPNIGGFEFLVLTYAGVTGESYIINIAGLTGDMQVPATDPRKNVHTRYMLFNAVPDGGSAAILLGMGLIGVGLLRRRSKA
jgi:hypothetical protein